MNRPRGFFPSDQQVAALAGGIGGWIGAVSAGDRDRMVGLHDRGLMERHPQDGWRFRTTAAGAQMLDDLEAQGVDVTRWVGGKR